MGDLQTKLKKSLTIDTKLWYNPKTMNKNYIDNICKEFGIIDLWPTSHVRIDDTTDIQQLDTLYAYCPKTGYIFYSSGQYAGKRADFEASGVKYRKVYLFGAYIHAHRLAWALFYRKWPENELDHIDGDPSNNKIENLRDVTRKVNAQNRRKALKNSKTGFLGVSKTKDGKYTATIKVDSKYVHLGTFSNPVSAHRVYLQAKRKYHEGCTI